MLTHKYSFTHPRMYYEKCFISYSPSMSVAGRTYRFISRNGDEFVLKGEKGAQYLAIQKIEEEVLYADDNSTDDIALYNKLSAAWWDFERLCRSKRKI